MTRRGRDLFAVGGDAAGGPAFEVALRGYDRRQVDAYAQAIEAELTAVTADREQMYAQAQALAARVEQLEAELAGVRRRARTAES